MSIQLLSCNGVSFSVFDDDDLSVFNHFLDRRFHIFLLGSVVFMEVICCFHNSIRPKDFGFNAIGEYRAYSEAVNAYTSFVPCVVDVGSACDVFGKHHGVVFAVGAVDAVTCDLGERAFDLEDVNL